MATERAPAVDVAAEPGGSPIVAVLAIRNYRYFWAAQFMSALVAGVLRFAFIWLALDLSDASAAEGLMGLSLGLPLLFLSLPAGVWSDRLDRRWLVMTVNLGAAAILLVAAVLIWTDVINLWIAMLVAFGSGTVQAATMPALQAMVPQIVPRERLMTGVSAAEHRDAGLAVDRRGRRRRIDRADRHGQLVRGVVGTDGAQLADDAPRAAGTPRCLR